MAENEHGFKQELVAILPRLRRFAFALAGSAADGDDLLQATVERALAKQDRFEPGTDLARWTFRIGRNIWVDEMRARKSRGEAVEIDERTAPALDGARALDAKLTLNKVEQALNELSEGHRAVVALVAMEGLSYKEAAAVLDLPIGTVMSRLARARSQLIAAAG